jgi:hypothetical protein
MSSSAAKIHPGYPILAIFAALVFPWQSLPLFMIHVVTFLFGCLVYGIMVPSAWPRHGWVQMTILGLFMLRIYQYYLLCQTGYDISVVMPTIYWLWFFRRVYLFFTDETQRLFRKDAPIIDNAPEATIHNPDPTPAVFATPSSITPTQTQLSLGFQAFGVSAATVQAWQADKNKTFEVVPPASEVYGPARTNFRTWSGQPTRLQFKPELDPPVKSPQHSSEPEPAYHYDDTWYKAPVVAPVYDDVRRDWPFHERRLGTTITAPPTYNYQIDFLVPELRAFPYYHQPATAPPVVAAAVMPHYHQPAVPVFAAPPSVPETHVVSHQPAFVAPPVVAPTFVAAPQPVPEVTMASPPPAMPANAPAMGNGTRPQGQQGQQAAAGPGPLAVPQFFPGLQAPAWPAGGAVAPLGGKGRSGTGRKPLPRGGKSQAGGSNVRSGGQKAGTPVVKKRKDDDDEPLFAPSAPTGEAKSVDWSTSIGVLLMNVTRTSLGLEPGQLAGLVLGEALEWFVDDDEDLIQAQLPTSTEYQGFVEGRLGEVLEGFKKGTIAWRLQLLDAGIKEKTPLMLEMVGFLRQVEFMLGQFVKCKGHGMPDGTCREFVETLHCFREQGVAFNKAKITELMGENGYQKIKDMVIRIQDFLPRMI